MATETPESGAAEGANMTTICTNEAEECQIDFNDKIRLYFLRYGLFAKHRKEEHLISPDSKEGEEQELTLPTVNGISAPSLEHFYVGITGLNMGYLYMFDANDTDLFYEYKIHINGKSQTTYEPIYVDENRTNNGNIEDHRVSSGEFETNKEFEKDQVLWIGYSQVQWTGEYYQTVIGYSDSERESVGMIKVECKGFPEGFGQEHVLQQSQVRATFTEDRKDADSWLDNTLEQINTYELKVKPDIKRDMFIILPDPVGCALDMAFSITEEFLRLRANLEGMKYAVDPETVYQAMQVNSEDYAKGRDDQEAMFLLALSSYQMVYNNSETIDEYDGGELSTSLLDRIIAYSSIGPGTPNSQIEENMQILGDSPGIDKNKLISTLGVDERKNHRIVINNLRSDFKIYLENDYYKESFINHLENDAAALIIGSACIQQLFSVLYINPHDLDKSLDLVSEYEEDPVIQSPFIEYLDTFEGTKLFNVIEEENELNLTDEIINQHPNILKTFFQIAERDISLRISRATTRLNAFEKIGKALDRLKINGQPFLLPQTPTSLNTSFFPQLRIAGIKYEQRPSGLLVRRGPQLLSPISTSRPATIPRPSYPSSPINITDNNFYNINGLQVSEESIKGLIIVVDIYNTILTLRNLQNDPNLRNSIDLLRSAAALGDSILSYKQIVNNSGLNTTLGKLFSRSSAGLSMGVSVMDAFSNAAARDHDAAIAHSLSALSGLVVLGAVILSSGGIALLFTVISLGFTVLAALLRDTPLQAFFKNFAFSDKLRLESNNLTAWEYNANFHPQREVFSNLSNSGYDRFENLSNFKDDLAALTDMVTNVKMTVHSLNVINNGFGFNSYSDEFNLVIEVNNILYDIEENLELKVVYRSGLVNTPNPNLDVQYFTPMRLDDLDGSSTRIRIAFNISGDFLEHHSNIYRDSFGFWILMKFNLDEKITLPSQKNDGKQYYYKTSYRLLGNNDSGKQKNAEIIALENI